MLKVFGISYSHTLVQSYFLFMTSFLYACIYVFVMLNLCKKEKKNYSVYVFLNTTMFYLWAGLCFVGAQLILF